MRLVVDTGILVSFVIRPTYQFIALFDHLAGRATLLASEHTLGELMGVLTRDRFDRWVSLPNRLAFIREYMGLVEMVEVTQTFATSADPKDDKFLDVAVSGKADCIIA